MYVDVVETGHRNEELMCLNSVLYWNKRTTLDFWQYHLITWVNFCISINQRSNIEMPRLDVLI